MREESPDHSPGRRLAFSRRLRLTATTEFRAVYDSGLRTASGPLIVFARPNGLAHSRIGLSIPRRVGGAVIRNRVRRRLRETFRLRQLELPAGYDLVVNVRDHEPLTREEYEQCLMKAVDILHRRWTRKNAAPDT